MNSNEKRLECFVHRKLDVTNLKIRSDEDADAAVVTVRRLACCSWSGLLDVAVAWRRGSDETWSVGSVVPRLDDAQHVNTVLDDEVTDCRCLVAQGACVQLTDVEHRRRTRRECDER